MSDRPKFFDDLAGVAGGAMSALAGLREEAESTMRARADEMIRKLDLVRREDLEAVQELAANARAAQVAMEARLTALEARLGASAASSSGHAESNAPASSTASPMVSTPQPAEPIPPRLADEAVAEGSPS